MISAADITVITPLVSYENTDPLWMFMASCRRFGITPTFFGKGDTYSGWVDIMLRKLMQAAKDCPTSHMLYTDSRDAFFLTGLDEIVEKYNAMGCPPLMLSGDCVGFSTYQKWYDKVPWDMSKPFPYFQVGGKIAKAETLANAIDWMFYRQSTGDWGEMPGDNPPWWCNFMAERPGELTIDHDCQIFQTCNNAAPSLSVAHGRVFNSITQTWPCILHFNGGFTDQVKGKWAAMEPMWRQLGYTESPPWEKK